MVLRQRRRSRHRALKAEYSGDKAMGIHFNYDGAAAWANYLLTHVPEALK